MLSNTSCRARGLWFFGFASDVFVLEQVEEVRSIMTVWSAAYAVPEIVLLQGWCPLDAGEMRSEPQWWRF